MRTKDNKMIRIAGEMFSVATIQNATDKLVLIFFMMHWAVLKVGKNSLLNYVTKWKQRVLYDRLGHGKSDPLDTHWSKATLKRKPIF
jgi:hypothetical protein